MVILSSLLLIKKVEMRTKHLKYRMLDGGGTTLISSHPHTTRANECMNTHEQCAKNDVK